VSVCSGFKLVDIPVVSIHKRWRNAWALHLVEQCADLFQVIDRAAIRVESTLARGTCWKRGDLDARSARRVYLIMEATGHWVLPELRII
jgi:hypothetical protein